MRQEKSFSQRLSAWSKKASAYDTSEWTEHLRILNEVTELITPELSLEEIIAAIYENVNQLLDAYQFAVGLYDEQQGTLLYKGMIEDGKRIPDFVIDVVDSGRLAAWCIRNEEEIFINDFDKEITKYVKQKPQPLVGVDPKAALYAPLKLTGKTVGLIVVRTIHKNSYNQHHLYLLKAVGNFVVRALEMSRIKNNQFIKGNTKEWRWCNHEHLLPSSKKIFYLLSSREKEVLFLLVSGASNKVIASKLYLSPGTIKTHTLNLYQKLNVANRTAAIIKAVELGWFV
jgi:DNA-binding CsgD family transcriptional regulator/transcriptional regulator with GAF, ATPase, and Fis domain